MTSTPQIICDIIQQGMGLGDDQIWIYNQRKTVTYDKRLYVTVGVVTIKPYGNNVKFNHTTQKDETSQYVQETLTINVFSYTTEALERYHEVMGSLISTYSQQKQALLGLRIAQVPIAINDVSAIEGTTILYRIAITLPVLRKYDKLITAEYYDTFQDADVSLTQ
jgi:hypothetical protein